MPKCFRGILKIADRRTIDNFITRNKTHFLRQYFYRLFYNRNTAITQKLFKLSRTPY